MNEQLLRVVAMMFAAQWTHLHNHWTCKGDSSYGDHLLFSRIYENIPDEIDAVMEKWVAMGTPAPMSAIVSLASGFTRQLETMPDLAARSLTVEKAVLQSIEKAFDTLESTGELSLGLNDLLAGICNTHETAVFLLQQRRKQAAKELTLKKVTTIPPADPLASFFQNPAFAETRQLAQSGAHSNVLPGHTSKAPPTVDDIIINDPGSSALSTLSRLKVSE